MWAIVTRKGLCNLAISYRCFETLCPNTSTSRRFAGDWMSCPYCGDYSDFSSFRCLYFLKAFKDRCFSESSLWFCCGSCLVSYSFRRVLVKVPGKPCEADSLQSTLINVFSPWRGLHYNNNDNNYRSISFQGSRSLQNNSINNSTLISSFPELGGFVPSPSARK